MLFAETVQAYAVTVPIHVHWGELGAHGVPGTEACFRYLETARTSYFARLGVSFGGERVGPVLGSISCEFLHPFGPGEELIGAVRRLEVGSDRIWLENSILSLTHAHVCLRGKASMFAYDFAARAKAPLPAGWCL